MKSTMKIWWVQCMGREMCEIKYKMKTQTEKKTRFTIEKKDKTIGWMKHKYKQNDEWCKCTHSYERLQFFLSLSLSLRLRLSHQHYPKNYLRINWKVTCRLYSSYPHKITCKFFFLVVVVVVVAVIVY